MKIYMLCLISIVLLSSCVQVQPLEVKSVKCCDLKKAFKSETEVDFTVEIHNPNSFPVSIKKYDLSIRLNGNILGNARNSESSSVPSHSTIEKKVSVVTSTKKLMSGTLMMGLNSLLKANPTTLEVAVVGSVVGNAKGISKRIRVRETYPIKMHP